MCIHDVVHDVYPTLQSDHLDKDTQKLSSHCVHPNRVLKTIKPQLYLKNSNPCITNVVKVNSSFVWVQFPCSTLIIILKPVDTRSRLVRSDLWTGLLGGQGAVIASHAATRHIGAPQHAVFPVGRADKGMVIGDIGSIVAAQEGNVVFPVDGMKVCYYQIYKYITGKFGRKKKSLLKW